MMSGNTSRTYSCLYVIKLSFVLCLVVSIVTLLFIEYGPDIGSRKIHSRKRPLQQPSDKLLQVSTNLRSIIDKLKSDIPDEDDETDGVQTKLEETLRIVQSIQEPGSSTLAPLPSHNNKDDSNVSSGGGKKNYGLSTLFGLLKKGVGKGGESILVDEDTDEIRELLRKAEELIEIKNVLHDVDEGNGYLNEYKKYTRDDQYKYYMRCPTTLRKRFLEDPELKKMFVPDVPILMWNKHLSDDEYERLSEFRTPLGWRNVTYQEVSDVVSNLNSPKDQYLFDLSDNGKVPNRCTRCAVVGNGGVLKDSKHGEEIDAHDYVFRVNVALTKGYEDDVGERTSHYVFSLVTLDNSLRGNANRGFGPPAGKEVQYVLAPCERWSYQYMGAALAGKTLPYSDDKYHRSPPQFPTKLSADNVKVLHPDFSRYLTWSWVNSPRQHQEIYRLQTGAFMTLLALHTCDEVNAYGLGASYANYTDHYYDKERHVSYSNHDYDTENKLWHRLHSLGVINLHT